MGEGSGKPRLGFLGVGWIGRNRMEAVAWSGYAEVAAIGDVSKEAVQGARSVAPSAHVSASFAEMLELGLDGIVIATPSALHAEQSLAALERGIAVFCQKPVGRTGAEVAEVIRAAQAADKPFGADLSYRHTAAVQAIRERVQSGEIGEIFSAELVFHNAYGPDKAWFYDPKLSGGGSMMDLGTHLVDLALWMLGFPKVTRTTSRLFAEGRPLPPDPDRVDDYAIARMDLATGASVQVACSWRLPAGCDAVISAVFYGTRGALGLRNVNGSFYDFVAEKLSGTSRQTLVSPPDAWGGRAAVDWAQRLAQGERFDPETARLVQVAETLDAIYGRSSPVSFSATS